MRIENTNIPDHPVSLLGGKGGPDIHLTLERESHWKRAAKQFLLGSSFTLFTLGLAALFSSVEKTEAQKSEGIRLRPHGKYGFITLPGASLE